MTWMFPVGSSVFHAKGGYYSIVAHARVEADESEVYVYRGDSGTWTRPRAEFEDGRFRRIHFEGPARRGRREAERLLRSKRGES